MGKVVGLTGNEAAAEAMRQINPDVVAAYPITPQTEAMHQFTEFVADGLVDTQMVLVESEHSAMSATVGAAAAGARAMSATSSQGLALMHEILYIAAALRLPIVMPMVNRALSGPINIHCDHSDSMGSRDSGWIQLFSENSQEVYDHLIMAIRIAEDHKVLTPAMVTYDGFIISHTMERLEILEDQQVKDFIGEYKPAYRLLDVDHPITVGPLDLQDFYFEHRRAQYEGMRHAPEVMKEVFEEYSRLSGRVYDFVEAYRMDDAETAIVCLGSNAGTTKYVVNELRQKGEKVGLLKIRSYRPFPSKIIAQTLADKKAVAVLDRSISFGQSGGPLYNDIQAALYDNNVRIPVVDYICGLGGRDVHIDHIKKVYQDLDDIKSSGKVPNQIGWLGLREKDKKDALAVYTEKFM